MASVLQFPPMSSASPVSTSLPADLPAPAGLEVRPVRTFRERRAFLHLPWKIYKNDPYWIPPLRMNQREMVNYKHHPFYDDNEIQTFLATINGEPVGRIAALTNHEHVKRYNEQRGFIGFFECIDNQAVANKLFNEARLWLIGHGMQKVRGPMNPSLNHEAAC